VWVDHGVGVGGGGALAGEAGDEVDNHADGDDADDDDENRLDEAIVFALQETNHGWT
jgi:hypothetical protein